MSPTYGMSLQLNCVIDEECVYMEMVLGYNCCMYILLMKNLSSTVKDCEKDPDLFHSSLYGNVTEPVFFYLCPNFCFFCVPHCTFLSCVVYFVWCSLNASTVSGNSFKHIAICK